LEKGGFMKDRLKKKLKSKKILGEKGRSFFPAKPKPFRRKVYEMPPDYNEYLHKLTELLDQQKELENLLPTLPPEARAEAMPHILALNESIEEFEQKMADEYEEFQNRQRKLEEGEREKNLASAKLMEMMERMFIVAKHKLEPAMFKEFEAKVTRDMSFEAKEEFYDEIAIRESYDLAEILADPNGKVKKPLKSPYQQFREAHFEVNRILYESDDFLEEACAELDKAVANRDKAEDKLWLYQPAERREQRLKIEELDRQIDEAKLGLIDYQERCFAEDGKIEIENPDEEKLNAAFDRTDIASERLYLMIKHTKPHLLEKYEQARFYDLTPEELEEARQRIAKREAEELDEILESCKP
jgi:hypothetical protein